MGQSFALFAATKNYFTQDMSGSRATGKLEPSNEPDISKITRDCSKATKIPTIC